MRAGCNKVHEQTLKHDSLKLQKHIEFTVRLFGSLFYSSNNVFVDSFKFPLFLDKKGEAFMRGIFMQ
jgi:hypothetical protein